MPKTIKTQPKEINVRQFWNLDLIFEYQPDFKRIVVKKPSGQVFIPLKPQDIRK